MVLDVGKNEITDCWAQLLGFNFQKFSYLITQVRFNNEDIDINQINKPSPDLR